MADTIFGSGNDQWVCPNDRQLALRAKLQTGWSVHTYQTEKQRRSQRLSPAEMEAILQVIQRAERLDTLEQQRIGCSDPKPPRHPGSLTCPTPAIDAVSSSFPAIHSCLLASFPLPPPCYSSFPQKPERLVERLETMRQNVMGNGLSQCLLCGEVLGFLGSSSVFCRDCRKVWKRSGAWFYKGIPKYILPLKTPSRADDPRFQPFSVEPTEPEPRITETGRVYTWARGRVVSSNSDSDSDLSSSSLEDRLPPSGTRDKKGNKPVGEAGGSMESPRMGLTRAPSHLSGSQSSLARETGTSSADPQGHSLPQPEPRGPGKRQTWATPRC
ncbi:rab effector Noc2 isoform X2 [Heterocephalus glaber]|uniref:Rab effector Noc2 isoform X2 n=1 Tax=Heterocephalus glaber TaxID=10181 RepID=A0AAX6RBZ7_HETGA|nr:rab effector Noc2 isoform X2 [Heterocephalus glaber]